MWAIDAQCIDHFPFLTRQQDLSPDSGTTSYASVARVEDFNQCTDPDIALLLGPL